MALFLGSSIVNKALLGVNKLNKIMLGVIEIFPNLAVGSAFTPADLFASNEQGAWYDFYDDMDEKIAFRRNLLTWSEDFTNALWTKTFLAVTPNAALAPDGTTTADRLVPDTVSTQHSMNQVPVAPSGVVVLSAHFKADQLTKAVIRTYDDVTLRQALFNLATGTVETGSGTVAAGGATISDVGGGWYRCCLLIGTTKGTALNCNLRLAPTSTTASDPGASWAGNGVDGGFIWGAQLEVGGTLTAYQKVTDWNTEFLAQYPTPTLYQDSIGNTPVTNVEQPIGRVLDKSGRNNHLIQATAASRPVLSARKNLLLNSAFTGGAAAPTNWVQPAMSGGSAPNGAVGNNTIYRHTAAATRPYFAPSYSTTLGVSGSISVSVYIDAVHAGSVEARDMVSWSTRPAGSTLAYYVNGALVADTAVLAAGDRVTAVLTSGGTSGTPKAMVGVGSYIAVTADISFSRPQIEYGPAATTYQRVITDTDYDTAGFPFFAKFDGVDDGMATAASVDFTATDKMGVFTGHTTTSTPEMLLELSVNSNSYNGSFYITAPENVANEYYFNAYMGTSGTFAANAVPPNIPHVLVGLLDSAAAVLADERKMFIDRVAQVNLYAPTAMSGNMGNHILYVGSRAGSTLPINGKINQIVLLGRTPTADEITNTESFIAEKTGVVLP